jgi:hypothetical protein
VSDGSPVLAFKAAAAPEEEDPLTARLKAGQRLLLANPAAAQTLFRALVREGRDYAKTPQGEDLRRQVARSELMRRGRVVWEGVTLNILEEDGDGALPSSLIEAFMAAAAHPDAETLLAGLFDPQEDLRGRRTDHSST